jgi:hypothetical protein
MPAVLLFVIDWNCRFSSTGGDAPMRIDSTSVMSKMDEWFGSLK